MRTILASALLFGLAFPALAAEAKDGDDVIWNGADYRLEGVDAFERPQMCDDASGQPYDCGAAVEPEAH